MKALGLLPFVCLAFSALAGTTQPKGRCDLAIVQIQEAKLDQKESARSDLMSAIAIDALELRELFEQRKPKGDALARWKKCFENKLKAFELHEQMLTDNAKSKFPYHVSKAKMAMTQLDYPEATMRLKLAHELRPDDFSLLQNYFQAWRNWKKQILEKENSNLIEVETFKREVQSILQKIIQHPNGSVAAKVEARFALYNDLIILNQEAPAMEELKAVLALHPSNALALEKLAAFEIRRGRPKLAQTYLEGLRKQGNLSADYFSKLVEIQLLQDKFEEAIETCDQALSQYPRDYRILALKASSLAEMDKLNEAQNIIQRLATASNRSKELRDAQSRVLEKAGDRSRKNDLIGKAMSEYKIALDLSPERLGLRIKMAGLIYGYRKEKNFEPKEVARKEMDEVLRLLGTALKMEPLREDVVLLYLEAAPLASLSAQAVELCENLEREVKGFPTATAVLNCAKVYVQNKRVASAKRILEGASFEARFSSFKEKLNEAFNGLPKN